MKFKHITNGFTVVAFGIVYPVESWRWMNGMNYFAVDGGVIMWPDSIDCRGTNNYVRFISNSWYD